MVKFVLSTDGSDPSQRALEKLALLAKKGDEVLVMTYVKDPKDKEKLEQVVQAAVNAIQSTGVNCSSCV